MLLLLLLTLVGCDTADSLSQVVEEPKPDSSESVSLGEEQIQEEAFEPFTFVDDLGVTHTFDEPAERVISTYSAMTEILFAIDAQDQLIGVGTSEAYPAEALEKPSFSYKDDPEVFIAAKPDVVLVRSAMAKRFVDTFEPLEDFGIRVVALDFHGDDFDDYVLRLARIVDQTDEAEQALKIYAERLQELKDRAAAIPENERLGVFFESREKDYRTAARGSMAYQTLEIIGVENVAEVDLEEASSSSVADYGVERILEKADRIDVYIAQEGVMNKGVTIEGIQSRPGFDAIRAVREDRVLIVDEKLISSPTFRQIEGAEHLFNTIYPAYAD